MLAGLVRKVGSRYTEVDANPGTNGTWANFIAGSTTTDSAVAHAGYIQTATLSPAGAEVVLRIPVFTA